MNIQKLITEHYQSLLSYFSVNQDSGILGVSNPDKNLKFLDLSIYWIKIR
jgi:hypothetical protein